MADNNLVTILMAEDDLDDRLMAREAFIENLINNPLEFVEDGHELMDYLYRRGNFTNLKGYPLPGLILLDLNMPRKDGKSALREIKADPYLKKIPIVIFTTSRQKEDVSKSYELGCSGFISKPVTFDEMIRIISGLKSYWIETVEMPGN